MDLKLSAEQIAVRASFAELFEKACTPSRIRRSETDGIDREVWRHYADMGAIGIGVAEDLGGGGAGLLEMALVAEEAGRYLAPIPVVGPAVAARLLSRLGSIRDLKSVLEGSVIVTVLAGSGNLRRAMLPEGACADAAIWLEGDRLMCTERPVGLGSAPTPNLGGMPAAYWHEAAGGELLAQGDAAHRLMEQARDESRVLLAAMLVGLASQAITMGARYALERRAFGQQIGQYQAVAHPFADAVTARDGAQILTWKACWALEVGDPGGPALAAKAFVFAAETAFQAAAHSLHVHGGYGFMEEYDIQLYYRRAKAWVLAFADPTRELLTVADRCFGPVARTPRKRVEAH